MPSRSDIAKGLFARCLEHSHKPGKVQFTKYLYLLDYCHWRLKGTKATDIEWVFYHYGPWSPAAEECMGSLAADYGFYWREDEEPVLRFVQVEESINLGLTIETIIKRIVGFFGNQEPMVVVEFAYSQTEPMLLAKRGDPLDFSSVPFDKVMPEFAPPRAKQERFVVSATVQERMTLMRAKAAKLRQAAAVRQQFRESRDYQTALEMLAAESHGAETLTGLRCRLGNDQPVDFGSDPA